MKRVLVLRGLAASGKSTFAKNLVEKDPNFKRVNRDSLREMIDGGKWSQNREKMIRRAELTLAELYISQGFNIVVDDTNLSDSAQEMWRTFAEEQGARHEGKFFDTPLEVCIERDLKRPVSVGEAVIRRMYNDYLRPAAEAPEHDPKLPTVVLCDLDGTLAHMDGRGPFEWHRVGEDSLDQAVYSVISNTETPVILMSGRDSVCRPETEEWLSHNGIKYLDLFMRPESDMRKDSIVKRELYEQHIKGKFNILYVLDDRKQVVDMWRRELGLKVFQVAEGDF